VQRVIDVVEVAAGVPHSLRSRVLGWAEPRSRLDGDDASHLAVIDGGAIVAVVSHMSWPCPDDTTTPARYGRLLLATVADRARTRGERLMWADARESAVPFYLACGAQVADAQPYVDEVTGLLDRRVVFVLDDCDPRSP